jgi:hypothetical protein
VSPRLAIALLVALLAVPPAYAGLVFAWQLTDVLAFTARLGGDALSREAWLQVAGLLLRVVGMSVALFVVGRMTLRARWPIVALAMAGAWGIAAPVLMQLPYAR